MPLNPYDEIDPPPESPVGRALRSLAYLGSTLAAVGLVLSFERDGSALWPAGRLLLLPGGVAFVLYAAWTYRFRPPLTEARLPVRKTAIGIALMGVALIGGGLDYLDPERLWLLLCAPFGVALLWFAVWIYEELPADEHGGWKGALAVACFGFAALGVAASALI